ncbi:glycoside hydrolase family 2 TIM barrel-domain containing protein [Pelagicoccus mobilis]|uniref:DUF4982 domain-containing protein n=1 Tax=Pelagicoccus mobilis TaxID=415221 RepID=A0A934RSN3_9BACT|nr:glycoside hydrolase family 2 TIM barrel-domain containing protein [Pelagicoccus mobilis]MBK1876137.1 DUF4982 domain-containing protein [Pelagicoccus mobilis]
MTSTSLTLSLASLAICGSTLAQGFGESQKIHEWRFHLADSTTADTPPSDSQNWRDIIVPHDWSVEYPASPDKSSCTGYLPGGIGWYQTEIDIPSDSLGDKRYYLYFEGVYNRSQVFLNGTLLGERPNGYVSFQYDITPHLDPGGENVLSVRVDHSLDADSRWYTGSGIYRPVHLVTANPIHFAQWGISYEATLNESGEATLTLEAEVENHLQGDSKELSIEHTLIGPDGQKVAATSNPINVDSGGRNTQSSSFTLSNPQLWSVTSPALYRLESRLTENGQLLDSSSTPVGIRSLGFDPDHGFSLNGEPMKIKGVCLHHDAGVLGSAVPKIVWRERLQSLKEIGVNGIRMSHNPQATDLYDLCDELGFLVMDEAFDEWEYPKKKWIKGWNKGKPGFQGSADFFEEWGERDLAAMVKRDRNHPSIIMWSIGNEVDYPNDPYSHPILDQEGIGQQHVAGYQKKQPNAERLGDIAKRLAAVVRKHDTSRPVTAALAGAVMSNQTEYPAALNVVGYNYTESRYEVDHKNYPERVLYGSETRHDLPAWKAVSDNDFIFGQFIWTGFDYLGESGRWPSRGFTTGMVDLANTIKPRGHFRRALWSDKPVAYLGTYPKSKYISMDAGRSWDYNPGQTIRAVCYTNGDEAELLLNGKTIGPRKAYDPETAIIHWDIPYQEGKLEVIAYKNGKPIARDSLSPDGIPTAIRAEPSKLKLASQYDVTPIEITIVDEQGQLVYGANHEIACEIKGPGRLLGLENASHDASENHRDNKAHTKNGRLVAYIQALESEGTITVSFSNRDLPSTELTLQIQR